MRVLWINKIEEMYVLKKEIGRGSYGVVWKAINIETNEWCVCKIVSRVNDYIRELDHLITVNNSFGVLSINQACFTKYELCMEFNIGIYSLEKYIQMLHDKNNYSINHSLEFLLTTTIEITFELLKGVSKIHEHGIVHRDLKTNNIIITIDSIEKKMKYWIIDFGMSKRIFQIDHCGQDLSSYEIVTCFYRAPELWSEPVVIKNSKGEVYVFEDESITGSLQEKVYDRKIDIWSLGCIMYEVLTGISPFECDNTLSVRERIAGYIYYITGMNCSNISHVTPKIFNIEYELDLFLYNFIHSKNNRNHLQKSNELSNDSTNSRKKLKEKKKILISTVNDSIKKHRRHPSNDGFSELSKQCQQKILFIKQMIKIFLEPDPIKRLDAKDILVLFQKFISSCETITNFNEQLQNAPNNQIVDNMILCNTPPLKKDEVYTQNAMDIYSQNYSMNSTFLYYFKSLFHCSNDLNVNPLVVYLSLYIWIVSICSSKQLVNEYSIDTILLSSFHFAISYCGEASNVLRTFRRQFLPYINSNLSTKNFTPIISSSISNTNSNNINTLSSNIRKRSVQKKKLNAKKELNCNCSILTLLNGKIWLRNPGDIRHVYIKTLHKQIWNKKIDKIIFDMIEEELTKDFWPPDPIIVMEKCKKIIEKM